MTTAKQALQLLLDGPKVAWEIGAALWPQRTGPICSSNGGGDYAAQMLLGRLRKKGLVRVCAGEGSSVWELTKQGRTETKSWK
ncbi:hypothetical protein LCGC14_0920150 [marine sediment metagenome]|uniref:Transcription regulator PadR N-terminal domain-containing protein n=1 Tax=marine sediment metagenome TaxID=412755 RepID=A0A0F9NR49_9ZZZZ